MTPTPAPETAPETTEFFVIEMLEATTCGDIRGLFWDDETLVGPMVFNDRTSASHFAALLLTHPNYRFVGYSVRPFMVPDFAYSEARQ